MISDPIVANITWGNKDSLPTAGIDSMTMSNLQLGRWLNRIREVDCDWLFVEAFSVVFHLFLKCNLLCVLCRATCSGAPEYDDINTTVQPHNAGYNRRANSFVITTLITSPTNADVMSETVEDAYVDHRIWTALVVAILLVVQMIAVTVCCCIERSKRNSAARMEFVPFRLDSEEDASALLVKGNRKALSGEGVTVEDGAALLTVDAVQPTANMPSQSVGAGGALLTIQ
ncbi:unnamed protein product [Toxocara canis]|uniref:Transmembrane protein n=1 Tax=Toxocara canis TaxID=6265 RepID=A0A183V9K4_TOXCA|nr:unnamed protein product [Toxocara canis]